MKKTGPAFSRSQHNKPNEELESAKGSTQAPLPPQPPMGSDSSSRYGIDDAIKLMRRLPRDDISLVASIVRETLESTNIKVDNIISDAEKKEKSLDDHISRLNDEITELKDMIEKRTGQINNLKGDLEETRQVKKDLAVVRDSAEDSEGFSMPDLELEPLAEDSVS